jgi:hypothetical protein
VSQVSGGRPADHVIEALLRSVRRGLVAARSRLAPGKAAQIGAERREVHPAPRGHVGAFEPIGDARRLARDRRSTATYPPPGVHRTSPRGGRGRRGRRARRSAEKRRAASRLRARVFGVCRGEQVGQAEVVAHLMFQSRKHSRTQTRRTEVASSPRRRPVAQSRARRNRSPAACLDSMNRVQHHRRRRRIAAAALLGVRTAALRSDTDASRCRADFETPRASREPGDRLDLARTRSRSRTSNFHVSLEGRNQRARRSPYAERLTGRSPSETVTTSPPTASVARAFVVGDRCSRRCLHTRDPPKTARHCRRRQVIRRTAAGKPVKELGAGRTVIVRDRSAIWRPSERARLPRKTTPLRSSGADVEGRLENRDVALLLRSTRHRRHKSAKIVASFRAISSALHTGAACDAPDHPSVPT